MTSDPYDPASHHARTGAVTHRHRRKYDAGLVPPPMGTERAGRFVLAVVLTAALSFFGAFYVIGSAAQSGCQQRQELSRVLIKIVNRGEPTLRELERDGTISPAQLQRVLADNAQTRKDLTFPPC